VKWNRLWWLVVLQAIVVPAQAASDPAREQELALIHAAEADFATWKKTGVEPNTFRENVEESGRFDLFDRVLTGDHPDRTELKPTAAAVDIPVTTQSVEPRYTTTPSAGQCPTVWRRITRDRFEIWTPQVGKLFDAGGKLLAEVKVRRGDGHGREWYGAFLPDGRWITTDIEDLDKELTMFSADGKRLWTIPGDRLIPDTKDGYDATPLIAWARSDKDGKAWVVSVGSESGRGWVKVDPDGKFTRIESPWKECFPQQLGPRGFLESKADSDDGSVSVTREVAGHGSGAVWPNYGIGETSVSIFEGGKFGILPGGWAIHIQSDYSDLFQPRDARVREPLWFYSVNGQFKRWINGRAVGTDLGTGGLWVRLPDDTCLRVDKGFSAKTHLRFVGAGKKTLMPLEIHQDIGLGLFLEDDKLVVGTWKLPPSK